MTRRNRGVKMGTLFEKKDGKFHFRLDKFEVIVTTVISDLS